MLSWPELRCLADDGLCVAPHGRCHELLDQVDETTLSHEVQGAREDVVQQLGKCSPFFAYPNGNFDRRAIRALQAAHYAAGFTTIGGIDTIPSDQPLLLRRDLAGVSLWRLALKLSGPVAQWRAGPQCFWASVTTNSAIRTSSTPPTAVPLAKTPLTRRG